MPPTPADLIEKLNSIKAALEPSDEELWNLLTKELRKAGRLIGWFGYNAIEANGLTQGENARRKVRRIWDDLPEKVKMYIGGYGEFQRLAWNYDEEELKFERNRFMKTMPTIKTRHEYQQMHLAIEAGSDVGRLTEGKG